MDNKVHRIMGLDYGDVRIGVALSDPSLLIATGLETYTRKTNKIDIEHLARIIEENAVNKVVFGLPLNMDGSEGVRVVKTKSFAEKLKARAGVEIDYYDERLSSVDAEAILVDAGVRRDKRKGVIDKLAATLILQGYLDYERENKNE